MDRVRTFAERGAISAVVARLPAAIQRRLDGVHFVSNLSPRFLGLHRYEETTDERFYDTTSHVAWEVHQSGLRRAERRTTVVLQDGNAFDPLIVLHELGHALDERLGFVSVRPDTWTPRLRIRPLDSYAASAPWEAFATGFQSWATHEPTRSGFFHDAETLRRVDPALASFFDQLAED